MGGAANLWADLEFSNVSYIVNTHALWWPEWEENTSTKDHSAVQQKLMCTIRQFRYMLINIKKKILTTQSDRNMQSL